MVLVCHVILQDHVPKGRVTLWEIIKLSYHPSTFSSHRHPGSGNITFLVCHVI